MSGLCDVCHREARGFGFNKGRANWKACSMEHLKILATRWRKNIMIDPTPNEITATLEGGNAGGEYLTSIGITDMAQLTAEQWQQFLLCITGGYCDKMAEFNQVPF